MKLNNRRTILIGLAFLSICAFWQLYDFIIPLILRERYHLGHDASGVVMALDNILALFMLPFFGKLSDRCNSRMGRRMPFILGGTVAAVALTLCLAYAQAHAGLAVFIALLCLLLIAMGTYRSPAVALMPDVTPKPLRSKGNAIINLMGALGGVFTLAAIQLLVRTGPDGQPDYIPLFFAVAILMAVSVLVLRLRIDENKLRREMPPEPKEDEGGEGRLPRPVLRSLLLILFSVFFWFMGYNAVTTAYSKYFTEMWGELSGAANCMMIATIGAVVSYIPVGFISSRIGRRRMILIGVLLLCACFAACAFITKFTPVVNVLFVLVGFAWASINVNSYPMVVEISRGSDVGRYTGYYYTFSMAAQIATPILSGILLERVGVQTLFPYAAAMVAVSFVTMLFVRHGDNKPAAPASALEALDAGDWEMQIVLTVILVLAGILLLGLWLTAPGHACARAQGWRGQLFAHRGLHGEEAAENGLAAFEAACRAGYGIELDVRFSRDGQLIVFHDDDLKRMCGDGRRPEALTVEELKRLRLGKTGEAIPTFDEVLALVDGRAPLLVEIKSCRNIYALTDAVVGRLKRYEGRYIVESFNPLSLYRLRRTAPEIIRGQLVASREDTAQAAGRLQAVALSGLLTNVLSRPDFIAYNIRDTKSPAPRLQRHVYRTPMAAWTVRGEKQLALARKRGDMIIFEKIRP